jgi:hypothetical protein
MHLLAAAIGLILFVLINLANVGNLIGSSGKLVKPVEGNGSKEPARFLLSLNVTERSPPQLDLSLGTRTCMVSDIKLTFGSRLNSSVNGLMACVNLVSRNDTVRDINGTTSETKWNNSGQQPAGPRLINARDYNRGLNPNLMIIPPPVCDNDLAMITFNPITVGRERDAQVGYSWQDQNFSKTLKILESWLKSSNVTQPPTGRTPKVAGQFVRDPCKEWLEAAGQVVLQHTLLTKMGRVVGTESSQQGSPLDFENTQVRSGFSRFLIASLILKLVMAFLCIAMSALYEVRTLDDVVEAAVMDGRGHDSVRGLFQSPPEDYHIGDTEQATVWTNATRSEGMNGEVSYHVPDYHWVANIPHVGLIRRAAPNDTNPTIEEPAGGF